MRFSLVRCVQLAAFSVACMGMAPWVQAQSTPTSHTVLPNRPPQASLLIQSSPLAGSQFHALPEVMDQIRVGDPLTLKREPDNPHDASAIQVFWQGQLLGFVPRRENRSISRAMDRGERLDARVVALRPDETPWRRLRFDISMPLDTPQPVTDSDVKSTR